MNDLLIKNFQGKDIHTFLWNDRICFIANEVVEVLEYADSTKTIQDCIKRAEFEVGFEYEVLKGDKLKEFATTTDVAANNVISKKARAVTIFYEDGLYGFLQYTDKPIGVRFRKWIRREVIPDIRKTGSYTLVKDRNNFKEDIDFKSDVGNGFGNTESLRIAYESAVMFKGLIEDAGLDSKVKLLTAKVLYSKAGVELPIEVLEEEHFYDTKQIASMLKVFSKTKKPAFQAISEIIKKLEINEDNFKVVWESNGSWSGTVNKYNLNVVDMIRFWLKDNNNPKVIEGKNRKYYVFYER